MSPIRRVMLLLFLLITVSMVFLGISVYQGGTDPFPGFLAIVSLLSALLLAYLSPKLSEDFEKRKLHTEKLRETIQEWLMKAVVPDGGESANGYLSHELKLRDDTAELESSAAMKDFMNNHAPDQLREDLHLYFEKKTDLLALYYALFDFTRNRSIDLTGLEYGVERPPRLAQMPRSLYRNALYSAGKDKPYTPDLKITETGNELWQLRERGENMAEAYDEGAIKNSKQAYIDILHSETFTKATKKIGEKREELEKILSNLKIDMEKMTLKSVLEGSCEYI